MRIIVSLGLVMLLAACPGPTPPPPTVETASFEIGNAKTPRGLLNVNNARLGYLYIWNRKENILNRIDSVDYKEWEISDKEGFDVKTSIDSGVKFTGGLSISDAEIVKLESEIKSKSIVESKNLRNVTISSPVRAMRNITNSLSGDDVDDLQVREVINSDGNLLYVLVSQVVETDSTEIKFDGGTSAGGKILIKEIRPQLDAEITTVGSFITTGTSPTFLRYSVLKPRWNVKPELGVTLVSYSQPTDISVDEVWDTMRFGNN